MASGEAVRRLNDAFRATFVGGAVLLTDAVANLPVEERAAILEAVRRFDGFDGGNDPHGEHDFGGIVSGERRVFFKIDYYDRDLHCPSPNPADPAVTTRVLTVMREEEY